MSYYGIELEEILDLLQVNKEEVYRIELLKLIFKYSTSREEKILDDILFFLDKEAKIKNIQLKTYEEITKENKKYLINGISLSDIFLQIFNKKYLIQHSCREVVKYLIRWGSGDKSLTEELNAIFYFIHYIKEINSYVSKNKV
jgi:hypothetical protein